MAKAARPTTHQDGYILVTVLFIAVILTVIGFALLSESSNQYYLATNDYFNANALYAAEAGVEESLYQLNQNSSFTGFSTPQSFSNNSTEGQATYTTTITPLPGGNAQTITSTGVTSRYNSSTPISSRIVKVTVVGTTASSNSVISGPGGLQLGGSATITNGPVYVNGTISLQGSAAIGTQQQPLTVNVANDACPAGSNPGPTYPQVCNNTQPISFQGSSQIYGSVCATGQTSSQHISGGNGGKGLEYPPPCTAPVISPPTYDRQAQINAVQVTGAGNSNTYVCNKWPFNRTWPANLELTGDVSIGGSCNVDIKGNVYITGNLSIGGAATVTVDNSVGTTQPYIITDGTISIGNSASLVANSSGTGMYFISFYSTAPCNPNCSSLSGNDLYNSENTVTVTVSGSVKLPGMILQAYWGEASIGASGKVGAVAGQMINLSGAGTIVFGDQLSSGSETWTITSYQQLYGPP